MELLFQNGVNYVLDSNRVGNKLHVYILCIAKKPDKTLPSTCDRYDLSETYFNITGATSDAIKIVKRLAAHEISALQPEVKKKVGEYMLLGSATFHIQRKEWQPLLKIKGRRIENKGEIQDLLLQQSILKIHTFPTVLRATEFALEFGEKLVNKQVPGLKV